MDSLFCHVWSFSCYSGCSTDMFLGIYSCCFYCNKMESCLYNSAHWSSFIGTQNGFPLSPDRVLLKSRLQLISFGRLTLFVCFNNTKHFQPLLCVFPLLWSSTLALRWCAWEMNIVFLMNPSREVQILIGFCIFKYI